MISSAGFSADSPPRLEARGGGRATAETYDVAPLELDSPPIIPRPPKAVKGGRHICTWAIAIDRLLMSTWHDDEELRRVSG